MVRLCISEAAASSDVIYIPSCPAPPLPPLSSPLPLPLSSPLPCPFPTLPLPLPHPAHLTPPLPSPPLTWRSGRVPSSSSSADRLSRFGSVSPFASVVSVCSLSRKKCTRVSFGCKQNAPSSARFALESCVVCFVHNLGGGGQKILGDQGGQSPSSLSERDSPTRSRRQSPLAVTSPSARPS